MKVLLSIKPEYAESILEGKKSFEFRKAIFKRSGIEKVVIYATMPVGKVVGEFDIDGILSMGPTELWEETQNAAGITQQFFDSYFMGREKAFAIKVKNPQRYKKPYELKKLVANGVAPQSYRYL